MEQSLKRGDVRRAYNNPSFSGSFQGSNIFFSSRGIPKSTELKKTLQSLEEYTLFRPNRKRFKRRRAIYPWIGFSFCADLIQLTSYSKENSGYNYILLCLDCFSKFMYCKKLKDKSGKTTARALEEIFKKARKIPRFIHTDEGLEFWNDDVAKVLKKYNVSLYSTHTQMKSAVAERAVRTIMTRISRYWFRRQNHRWVDVLDKICASYNSTYHTSIKMAPKDVTEQNSADVFRHLYHSAITATPDRARFKIGDRVHVSGKKLLFEKGYSQNYSKDVYIIKDILTTNPITYTLFDEDGNDIEGSYYFEELVPASSSV